MVLKHDGIIMAKDIIEFPEGTDGFDLTDKSEKITDTEIFTDKADDSVVHVEVDGKSYQHAGSGKNLFAVPYPDALKDFIRPNDYWVKPITLKANTQYTLSTKLTGNLIKDATVMVWSGGNRYADRDVSYHTLNTHGNEKTNIFNTGDMTEWKIAIYLTSDLESSKELLGELLDNYQIQLEEGSTATAYEPPAPTPDYPIEIHSLNDFDVVSSVGKRNLIPTSLFIRNEVYLGLKREFNQNGTIIFDGQPTQNLDASIINGVKIYLKKGQTYTFSIEHLSGSVSADQNLFLSFSNNEGISQMNYVTTNLEKNKITFKVDEDGYIHRIRMFASKGVLYDNYTFRIKLEKGNIATDWTPAPEDITENDNHPLIDKINLSVSEPLRSVGDVKDRLFRGTDGLWKIERNIYSQLLNGSERWSPMTNLNDNDFVGFHFYTEVDRTGSYSSVMSSHFTQGTNDIAGWNKFSEERNLMGIQDARGQTKIIINGNILPSKDIDGFRNWLKNNNVRIQYIKPSFSIEILDQELQDKLNNLRSFQDSNYIYTIVDKTDTLPTNVAENLKPTLHARFKSEDYGILNNHYGINYPDKITYLGTYFKHGDLVTQEFIESED